MLRINAWLPGQPARVTHQSGIKISGHRIIKTKALLAWEAELTEKLRSYKPAKPIEGPVMLKVTFGYKPQRKKDLGTYKITRPDTDNSIKTVKDVMSKLGFWKDDAQVVYEVCKKIWVSDPGIVIVAEELGGTVDEWREGK